jgi:transposase
MKNKAHHKKDRKKKISVNQNWDVINPDAAGIDLGSAEHWVAVPPDRDQESVRCFGTFTADLEALVEWLKACRITSVAMEATGVFWIPIFQILEKHGFKVTLANARHLKNVSGRKSDIADCQWIQKLHTFGLIGGSFRPADAYCVLRSYARYRDELVSARSTQIQHMQKALQQMNLQLTQVLSDLTGESGLAIVQAILEGKRDPVEMAALAHRRVKAPRAVIAKALVGDYREEHLFQLKIALELYQIYQAKIRECDDKMIAQLDRLPTRVDLAAKPLPPRFSEKKIDENLRLGLYLKFGVDITAIEGIGQQVALVLLSEVGADLSRFPTVKHWTSWLGLCPDNRISGGKVLSCRTRRVINRLSDVLRMAATTLERSKTAMGAYYRRMKAKLGAAEAVTAAAHKLARLLYGVLTQGDGYIRESLEKYERRYQSSKLQNLKKMAKSLGCQIIEPQSPASTVS